MSRMKSERHQGETKVASLQCDTIAAFESPISWRRWTSSRTPFNWRVLYDCILRFRFLFFSFFFFEIILVGEWNYWKRELYCLVIIVDFTAWCMLCTYAIYDTKASTQSYMYVTHLMLFMNIKNYFISKTHNIHWHSN